MDISSNYRKFEQTFQSTRQPLIVILIILLVLSLTTTKELLAETDAGQGANLASNKAAVLKFVEEVVTNRKIDLIDGLAQPDVLLQLQSNWYSPVSGTSQVIGKENFKKHYEAFFALWDKKAEWFKVKIEDVIAEGDTVAMRANRVYMDRKSKKVVARSGMSFFKLKEGKIAAMYLIVADPKLTK